MITVKNDYFYLHTENTSYIMRTMSDGTLSHCYYGARVPEDNMDFYHLFVQHDCTVQQAEGDYVTTPDALPMECSGICRGDYRRPAVVIQNHQGRTVNEYKYKSHQIISGKPVLEGLPQFSTNVKDVQTLEIVLVDIVTGVEIVCSYSVFESEDVITRHTRINNVTDYTVQVEVAASAMIDFERADFDVVSLGGIWERERHIERYPLHRGEVSVASRYGMSGHHSNPFMALAEKNADETQGQVYGAALVYSGNFMISAEAGQFGGTRVWMGIHPELFTWELKPQDCFTTPEAVLTFTEKGFGGMSRNFHSMCRMHLGACADTTNEHPVVLNLWEATGCDISEEKLLQIVEDSKGLGIDTLVIDDGWFGKRNEPNTSLGDWYINREKFPRGLQPIVEACEKNHMQLGIWFEPEMVSPNSNLYRKNPDWCIHVPGVKPTEIRDQLVLDMSRTEVVEAIYESVAAILNEYHITYVKWDMNRSLTDVGSEWLPIHRQKEHCHRHVLGVYALMDRLTQDFPHVFFEGCASGGGRFDFGVLYFMPQIWASDCTDAWERMLIQYGTSYVYPTETISAHVSACPNHATGRQVPFRTRCDVASFFSYGYEFDPTKMSNEDREEMILATGVYRRITEACENGLFYRLRDPFNGNTCAWQVVSKDGSYSAVFYATKLREANFCGEYLRIAGLCDEKLYRVEPLGIRVSGKTLKSAGLPIRSQGGDFYTKVFEMIEER